MALGNDEVYVRDLSISFGERSSAKKQLGNGVHAERPQVAPVPAQQEVRVAPTRARAQIGIQVALKRSMPWSMGRATAPLYLPVGKRQRQGFQISEEATGEAHTEGGLLDGKGVPVAELSVAGEFPTQATVAPAPPIVVGINGQVVAPIAVAEGERTLTTPVVEVASVTPETLPVHETLPVPEIKVEPKPAPASPEPAPAVEPAPVPEPEPLLKPEPTPAPEPVPDPLLEPETALKPELAPALVPAPRSHFAKPRSRRRPFADPEEVADVYVAGAYEMPVSADTAAAAAAVVAADTAAAAAANTAAPASFPRRSKLAPSEPVSTKTHVRPDKAHAKDASASKVEKQRGTHSKRERKNSTLSYILVALRDVAIVLALFCILLQFFSPTVVREHSMEDTLVGNDILFVANKAYWFGSPEYGDIVLFHTTLTTADGAEKTLVKRIIGLPGDRITINGGVVFRNGQPLDEPYLKEGVTAGAMSEIEVDADSYFVMGDNRAISRDSRDSSVGLVRADQLRGKIVLRIFPLGEFRMF